MTTRGRNLLWTVELGVLRLLVEVLRVQLRLGAELGASRWWEGGGFGRGRFGIGPGMVRGCYLGCAVCCWWVCCGGL